MAFPSKVSRKVKFMTLSLLGNSLRTQKASLSSEAVLKKKRPKIFRKFNNVTETFWIRFETLVITIRERSREKVVTEFFLANFVCFVPEYKKDIETKNKGQSLFGCPLVHINFHPHSSFIFTYHISYYFIPHHLFLLFSSFILFYQ